MAGIEKQYRHRLGHSRGSETRFTAQNERLTMSSARYVTADMLSRPERRLAKTSLIGSAEKPDFHVQSLGRTDTTSAAFLARNCYELRQYFEGYR